MATYNKRGYKAPKPKEEKEQVEVIEDVNIDETQSTTAGVFNTLDETASKTEAFVAKNQKVILGIVAAITLSVVGYFAYTKFIVEPKEDDASAQMYLAQQNFQKALDGTKSDSLYNLALNGSEGKYGFLKIAEEYSGTAAGNMATYYAGMAYLNTKQYDKAISFLEKFDGKDRFLKILAAGAIGDAYAEKNQLQQALDQYVKAAELEKNDFTTPRFLLKAGKAALALGKKADALKYFTSLKESYESTPEGQQADTFIGLSQ
jgi:tetratricopeptide (TPR) repeat protein